MLYVIMVKKLERKKGEGEESKVYMWWKSRASK